MKSKSSRKAASNPQELERLLIDRQWAGDIEGMVALYEPTAVLDDGEGQLAIGKEQIRAVFAKYHDRGVKFSRGQQSAAIVSRDLALTSTCLSDGSVTAEVARRQTDGTWLWAIDRFTMTEAPSGHT